MVDKSDELIRIDPRRNRVVARIKIPGATMRRVAVGEGAVWVLDRTKGSGNQDGGRVRRIDPATNRPFGRPGIVEGKAVSLAVGGAPPGSRPPAT